MDRFSKSETYFIVGDRPVYIVPIPEYDTLEVKAYDWKTGEFISAFEYFSIIVFSWHDEIEEVSKEEFDEKVKILRSRL
jgi:hypothetical protein